MSDMVVHKGGDGLRMNQVVPQIEQALPEYWAAKVVKVGSDPHVVAGDFAIWLSEIISEGESFDSPLLLKSFSVINRFAHEGDDHVINLVEISILEPLLDELEYPSSLRSLLSGEALLIFDRLMLHWYN